MTKPLPQTKAEQSLAADFAARASELPGKERVAKARAQAMVAFAEHGLPHRRVEAWKYTDLRTTLKDIAPFATHDETPVSLAQLNAALKSFADLDADRMVFVNGRYRDELSDVATGTEAGLTVGQIMGVKDIPGGHAGPEAIPNDAIVALNAALVTDGCVIVFDKARTRPVLIVSAAAGPVPMFATLSHQVTLNSGTSATVIEAHITLAGAAPAQSNSVCLFDVRKDASLTHVMISVEGAGATHLETIAATIGANATFKSFQLTAGTGLARTQSFVTFRGEHAKLDISGLMLGRGRDHIDTTMVIDHAVPHCESRELFKAVLDDTARAVFQGTVIVRPDAQKTDGKQMAKALMLSEACEFDSKPELEIYADDVVCGHGATVAEIDAGMMFYLRSRGIPKDEARTMLIESFVGEALDKIDDDALRATLSEITLNWLAAPNA